MCKDGVTEKDFDEIVVSLSNRPKSIVLLSATKASTFGKKDSHTNKFCQIFASGGSSHVDRNFKTYQVPITKLAIHHKICQSTSCSNFVPLSTGCFDVIFHDIQVFPKFIKIINHTIRKQGIYTSRCKNQHFGSCFYLGERVNTSQSVPSPSEGPHEHGQWYYQRCINHMYWPFVLHCTIGWVVPHPGWIFTCINIWQCYSQLTTLA